MRRLHDRRGRSEVSYERRMRRNLSRSRRRSKERRTTRSEISTGSFPVGLERRNDSLVTRVGIGDGAMTNETERREKSVGHSCGGQSCNLLGLR